MGMLLSDEERESLKRDLVGPVKSFLSEVRDDTVGDAKRYYTDRARKAEQGVRRAQEKTKAQLAQMRREQEELKKHRRAMMKMAAIILALLALFSIVAISAAFSVNAETPQPPVVSQKCLEDIFAKREGLAACCAHSLAGDARTLAG